MSGDPVMQVEDKIVSGPSVTSEKSVTEETIIRQEVTVITTTGDEAAASNGSASAATSPTTASAQRPRLKKDNSTPNMNGPLYMQTAGNKTVLVRRLKRKEESTWKHLSRWFVENQIGTFFFNQPASPLSCRSWIANKCRGGCRGVGTGQGVRSNLNLAWLKTFREWLSHLERHPAWHDIPTSPAFRVLLRYQMAALHDRLIAC